MKNQKLKLAKNYLKSYLQSYEALQFLKNTLKSLFSIF